MRSSQGWRGGSCPCAHRVKVLEPLQAPVRPLAPRDDPVHDHVGVVPLHSGRSAASAVTARGDGYAGKGAGPQHSAAWGSGAWGDMRKTPSSIRICPCFLPRVRDACHSGFMRPKLRSAAPPRRGPTSELVATNSFLPLRRIMSSSGTSPGSSWMYLQPGTTGQPGEAGTRHDWPDHAGRLAGRQTDRQVGVKMPAGQKTPRGNARATQGPPPPLHQSLDNSPAPAHFSGLAATSRLMLPSRWHKSTAPRTSLHVQRVACGAVGGRVTGGPVTTAPMTTKQP